MLGEKKGESSHSVYNSYGKKKCIVYQSKKKNRYSFSYFLIFINSFFNVSLKLSKI